VIHQPSFEVGDAIRITDILPGRLSQLRSLATEKAMSPSVLLVFQYGTSFIRRESQPIRHFSIHYHHYHHLIILFELCNMAYKYTNKRHTDRQIDRISKTERKKYRVAQLK